MNTSLTKRIPILLGFWCMVMGPALAQLTPSSNAAIEIISGLAKQIQLIGANTASASDYEKAEFKARDALSKLISSNPPADVLLERAPHGTTPLMLAAFYGFPGLTEELLKSDVVKASINEKGPNQATAWMIANYGMRQAMWSCDPATLNEPFAWVSIYGSQPYYRLHAGGNPYQMTRRVLEDAGAIPDLVGLKSAWLKTCPMSEPNLKARICASADVLQTLLEDSPRRFSQFETETRKRFNQENTAGPGQKEEELESKLRKISLQGYELPTDLAIKPPKAEFGTVATTLSGWWLCQISFLQKFELLLIFEEFKSAHEVVMITASPATDSRPARSRRVTATVDGDVVTFLLGDQSPVTLTLQPDGALQGEFVTRGGKARFPFRKSRP
ncbi:hypothetical protein [Polaromonas sp. YR568]|uniref:hypothetical protein n=1 Tax=Polaromonas sp. YR568 TaxID=1855301 RepID=UPI00398C0B76